MREFWVHIEEAMDRDLKKNLIQKASKTCSAAIVGSSDSDLVRSVGLRVAGEDGDIVFIEEKEWNKARELKVEGKLSCARVEIHTQEDEGKALKAAESGVDFILVTCPDWKVIPLENLIAKTRGKVRLLAEVSSPQEAKLALETLELGVDGIVLRTGGVKEVEDTARVLGSLESKVEKEQIPLVPAKVVNLKQLSLGYRVCIDTCDIMALGEGMLIGCQSSGLFLVQAEIQENPHIEPRPFRVNAGPVSLYILTPGNKTRYLSELRAGDEVLVANREGALRSAVVGRVKIERRPLMLIETEVEGRRLKTIAQNAETIRLVTKDSSKSITELKVGDEVLVHYQLGGRHFGILVAEESVIER